jgi:hypothetical protein
MRGAGYIIHWSNNKGRGMIHLGGKTQAALLSFSLADCNAKLKGRLRQQDIPSGPAVHVQFGVAIRKGGLTAAPVSLATEKRAGRTKAKSHKKSRRKS